MRAVEDGVLVQEAQAELVEGFQQERDSLGELFEVGVDGVGVVVVVDDFDDLVQDFHGQREQGAKVLVPFVVCHRVVKRLGPVVDGSGLADGEVWERVVRELGVVGRDGGEA